MQELLVLHSDLYSSLTQSARPLNSPQLSKSSSRSKLSSQLEALRRKDAEIESILKSSSSFEPLQTLKKNLAGIRRLVTENSNKINRDFKKVSMILQEYKDRCTRGFVDFLKNIDLDLRKALKPLVPNDVLKEQLKYKPLNPEAVLQGSIASNPTEDDRPSDSTTDKLNNHIHLLITTLEGVAKDLIAIAINNCQKYYEITDPLALYSEPPSPLAAPLPDYFSYDLANVSQEELPYERVPMPLSEVKKQKIIEKVNKISSGFDKSCSQSTALKIREKLMILFKKNVKELDLMEVFKEEGVPMTEREKIVFDIINTDRSHGRDVNLDDIILANEYDVRNSQFEVSRNDYSDLVKNLEGVAIDLTDRLDGSEKFGSLESSIDEKLVKRQDRVPFIKAKPIVPIGLERNKSKKDLKSESRPSLGNIRLRTSTPSKLIQKSNGKRSHTPGIKKKKRT